MEHRRQNFQPKQTQTNQASQKQQEKKNTKKM